MYINKIVISNIRSIPSFTMEFQQKPGWHVIIGDNGSGKTTLIRSIALALVGQEEAMALRQDWSQWLRVGSDRGEILLEIEQDKKLDYQSAPKNASKANYLLVKLDFVTRGKFPRFFNWVNGRGWFSAAYGPFRRFTGGNKDLEKLFHSNPKLAAHLSAFGEDVALSESLEWLKTLQYKKLESKEEGKLLDLITKFINEGGLLPHNTLLSEVSSDGIYFTDGNGSKIPVIELSDGYRSVLSLTFELIRQLIQTYDSELVFEKINQGEMYIDLPGVVLIDEIDVHLHPTWQVKIGNWFLKYFPKIQFIIATHSPLICRAAEHGSIWQLAAPGSSNESAEIKGNEQKRLIYGNILDAYSTEAFGQNVTRSESSHNMQDRLAHLNRLSIQGKITENEQTELNELKAILPTS